MILVYLFAAELRSFSRVSRRMKLVVKAYMEHRLKVLFHHFRLRPDFREKLMGGHGVVIGGLAAVRYAQNDSRLANRARMYVRRWSFPDLDHALGLAGYTSIGTIKHRTDVLRHSPVAETRTFMLGYFGGFRVLEVNMVEDDFRAEQALISTPTIASMTYITKDSLTVFFPRLFHQNRTVVRRIPSALAWRQLAAIGWPLETKDLPVLMQCEVEVLEREAEFCVKLGFVRSGTHGTCSWDCPANALRWQPLFWVTDIGEGPDRTIDFWDFRRDIAAHTKITQFGQCLAPRCRNGTYRLLSTFPPL